MSDLQERRTKFRIQNFLNGLWDKLEPEVRQAIVVLADEVDGLHDENRALRASVDNLRKTVLWIGSTIAGALLSVTVSLVLAVLR